MTTKARLRGKKSKKEKTAKKWFDYKYAMAQIVFSDEPLKNPFGTKQMVLGRAISPITGEGLGYIVSTLGKTVEELIKEDSK